MWHGFLFTCNCKAAGTPFSNHCLNHSPNFLWTRVPNVVYYWIMNVLLLGMFFCLHKQCNAKQKHTFYRSVGVYFFLDPRMNGLIFNFTSNHINHIALHFTSWLSLHTFPSIVVCQPSSCIVSSRKPLTILRKVITFTLEAEDRHHQQYWLLSDILINLPERTTIARTRQTYDISWSMLVVYAFYLPRLFKIIKTGITAGNAAALLTPNLFD